MEETIRSPAAFDAWFAGFEADVAADGLELAWQKHFKEVVKWHAAPDAPSMLGPHLDRILRADPEVAGRLEKSGSAFGTDAKVEAAGEIGDIHRLAYAAAVGFSEILEGDGTPVKCIDQAEFENWGRTVQNMPALTCFPHSKIGVCNIVKWAISQGKRVRAAGYRHSWSDIFSNDGEVLISMLSLEVATILPAVHPPIDPRNELQGIQVVGNILENGTTKALCKIGAATSNEQFRRWCLDPNGGNMSWTLPFNVVMVEITFGGSNGPICHGAGLQHETLSDLVTEVEFVNTRGELQVVNDPEQLRAASGAFGLIGVVTAITLKLDPMTFAKMQPIQKRLALAVPPISRDRVPPGVDMSGVTDENLLAARADFIRRCEEDYYPEWFWFPLHRNCWINTWKNNGDRADQIDYPSPSDAFHQQAELYFAGLTDLVKSSWVPETTRVRVLSWAAMALLPDGETIVTPLIDALHFVRGIQNRRVRDCEWEIPIPGCADDPGKPDWSICQEAWWAVIREVLRLEKQGKAPMQLALEMRIMGGSSVTMAPQHGNTLGTCSIEVLTTMTTDTAEWAAFIQTITDAWAGLTDAAGRPLNLRPHWAKEWQGLKVRGKPILEYLLNDAYKERLPEFRRGLAAVAQTGSTTIPDMQRVFSNALLDEVFRDVFA